MRPIDRGAWIALGGVLCGLGGSILTRTGLGFVVLGLLAIALGLYVVLASILGWPLPKGPVSLSPEQQMIQRGLEHLIEDGQELLHLIETAPGDYYRAYSDWIRQAEKFIGDHLTVGHLVKFRSVAGLESLAQEYDGQPLYMRRYLKRLEGFKVEPEG